jgi:hypothetical protein
MVGARDRGWRCGWRTRRPAPAARRGRTRAAQVRAARTHRCRRSEPRPPRPRPSRHHADSLRGRRVTRLGAPILRQALRRLVRRRRRVVRPSPRDPRCAADLRTRSELRVHHSRMSRTRPATTPPRTSGEHPSGALGASAVGTPSLRTRSGTHPVSSGFGTPEPARTGARREDPDGHLWRMQSDVSPGWTPTHCAAAPAHPPRRAAGAATPAPDPHPRAPTTAPGHPPHRASAERSTPRAPR